MKYALTIAALLCPGAFAHAQTMPFPLEVEGGPRAVSEEVRGLLRVDELPVLAAVDRARLEGLPLPGGLAVDLDLTRIDLDRRRFGFRVDGEERPDLLAGLELSVWRGVVVGDPGSTAMLSFSNHGARGWVRTAGRLVHLLPQPDEHGRWTSGRVTLIDEATLDERGMRPELSCATPAADPGRAGDSSVGDAGPAESGGSSCFKECKVAIETDHQLFRIFGDLPALAAYTATLLGFVSDRFEGQAGTVLTFPYVQFYTTPDDPWTAQDEGGDCIDVLDEFKAAWTNDIPGDARLGHLLSGARLGCGVAYLNVLCPAPSNAPFRFGVTGNVDGLVDFPVMQQPDNWDFYVLAHELGHNFGAKHTHDYCPPLDECPPLPFWGACQDERECTSEGTLMSYCSYCQGRSANITTFFHPHVSDIITSRATTCLPDLARLSGLPVVLASDAPTPVTIKSGGTPVGPVELHYRYDDGPYATVAMSDEGNSWHSAELPPTRCGDRPELYFAYTESICGPVTKPAGGAQEPHAPLVGRLTSVFADKFEVAQGWRTEVVDATAGAWERGVPVADPEWPPAPRVDYDGSGSCYLTSNDYGESDVDKGSVRLYSPIIDMSGGIQFLDYAYYLYLLLAEPVDGLRVDISSQGPSGPWTKLQKHGTTSFHWRTHTISLEDLLAEGVELTDTMQLRFTAKDKQPVSIVEAGVDAFEARTVDCGGIGESYCRSTVNSTSLPARIRANGGASVAANELELVAVDVPAGQTGLFFYGPTRIEVPFGGGYLCVGAGAAGLSRLPLTLSSESGILRWSVDLALEGRLESGTTWNFQAWFRDTAAAGFDLSDGLTITFTP